MNYSLIHENRALNDARFTDSDLKKLENPISSELACLRPSLLAQMLETVERNISRQNSDLALFETGLVYCANSTLFPEERMECCIALTGKKHPERFSDEKEELYDFYDLKGILESWLDIRKEKYSFRLLKTGKAAENFTSSTATELLVGGKPLAALGEVAPRLVKGMRLNTPLFVAIIQLSSVINKKQNNILYKPVPQYPSTARDVAFIANNSLEHGKIIETINNAKVKNLEKIELFDIFEDEKVIGKNKKSMAYSLTFRNSERTLTDKEVNVAHEKLRAKLAKELSVELR